MKHHADGYLATDWDSTDVAPVDFGDHRDEVEDHWAGRTPDDDELEPRAVSMFDDEEAW